MRLTTTIHMQLPRRCLLPLRSPAFVVHKSRGITTLASMHSQQQQQLHQQQQQQPYHHQQSQLQLQQQQQEPLVPARLRQAKEKTNVESKADERGLPDSFSPETCMWQPRKLANFLYLREILILTATYKSLP